MDSTPALPVFENVLKEVLDELANDASTAALDIVQEGRNLLSTLQGWAEKPPTGDERRLLIDEVFTIHRKAKEYLASKKPSVPSGI